MLKSRPLRREYFTYLQNCEGEVEVVIGDARIQLERDVQTMSAEGSTLPKFDILIIDAFSSDAIPAHLLTTECFELYQQALTEEGVLAVHISNRYLDLEPVVYNSAKSQDWPCNAGRRRGANQLRLGDRVTKFGTAQFQ